MSSRLISRSLSIASHLRSHSPPISRSATTMATAATLSLTPNTVGVFHVPKIEDTSCQTATSLLQKNHDNFHMYFNSSGFHNHIAHHLLTILALGATPSQIQSAYDANASYQRPQFPVSREIVTGMSDPETFAKYLGNEKYFHDYEIYFRKLIEDDFKGSWQDMLRAQLFSNTPQAKDLLVRMFAGFYHPIIHLGFGIEFNQPAVIVEALAQAATHDNWPKEFIETTSRLSQSHRSSSPTSLFTLLSEARANKTLVESPHQSDGNKLRDGVLKRAMPEITQLCSRFTCSPNSASLRMKTAEMINLCAYFSGASQHASHRKQVKFDFFYMHCINCSLFFSAFLRNENDWMGDEVRATLLEYKAWSDLAMYVSRGSPELFPDEIRNYKAKRPNDGWSEIFKRVDGLMDDGHASKLVRAFANGEAACREFEGTKEGEEWMVKGDMWLKLGHMAIDSVEGTENRWIRNTGFESAWENVPERGEAPNQMDARSEGVQVQSRLEHGEGYHEV